MSPEFASWSAGIVEDRKVPPRNASVKLWEAGLDSARSTPDSATVLLVEDDEAARISIAGLLRHAGYTVHVAPDYRLALSLLECAQPIDLLVTDIVMPDRVNGLALARMARLRRPGIKLLYITGYDIPRLTAEALGPVVRKPFADEEFLNAVHQLLQPHRAA